jgi:hypothetical protein
MTSSAAASTTAETDVRSIVRSNLLPLIGIASAQGDNHNVFLEAISPPIAISSKLTRSLTSRLGKRFASIARDLAVLRYGADKVPAVLYSHTVEAGSQIATGLVDDTLVVTAYDQIATRRAAIDLMRHAKTHADERIGTSSFRDAFRTKVADLESGAPAAELWSVRVDLFVDDPLIGLAELESGGELDSSNVKSQPEKLVLAGLALGDPDVPLHFCLAYANKGEGRPIRGGLPGYLAYEGDDRPSAGLLVGRRWWERLLPAGVAFERFVELFAEVADELEILPPEVRR